MSQDQAIWVADLKKVYRNGFFRPALEALGGVSLSVERGEIFGLLGPNGAGKTTFIKILLGIVRRTAGNATILQRPAGHQAARKRIGYLPENLRIAAHHTARSALSYYGRLSGMSRRQATARTDAVLDRVGLLDRKRDRIKKYSKGMLQRLGLAQALLHQPDLLILDEPTDGLDPLGRSQVRELLRELKREGCTVFLNSHILQEVELVCDRVAILNRGKLLAIGKPDELAPQQHEELELLLTVTGSQAAVRTALSGHSIRRWEQLPDNHQRITLQMPDQASVDDCVDRLREQGVSVVDLTRRRLSLEDAFLQLLDEPVDAEIQDE